MKRSTPQVSLAVSIYCFISLLTSVAASNDERPKSDGVFIETSAGEFVELEPVKVGEAFLCAEEGQKAIQSVRIPDDLFLSESPRIERGEITSIFVRSRTERLVRVTTGMELRAFLEPVRGLTGVHLVQTPLRKCLPERQWDQELQFDWEETWIIDTACGYNENRFLILDESEETLQYSEGEDADVLNLDFSYAAGECGNPAATPAQPTAGFFIHTNHNVYFVGFTDTMDDAADAEPVSVPDPIAIAPDEGDDTNLQAELEAFDDELENVATAREFFEQLRILYNASGSLTDLRHAQHLLDSILPPELAAQASIEAAMAPDGLSIGGFMTRYLVKHAYAREAPFTRFIPEDVALSLANAMFNISVGVLTGGTAPLMIKSISTTSKIIDSVIAYRGLHSDTDELVDDAQAHALDALDLFREGTLSADQALAHFELTQQLSENLLGRRPALLTPRPTREAAFKLQIIAQLGRIRIEQSPTDPDLELKENVRADIRRRGQEFQAFADAMAERFGVMHWEPLADDSRGVPLRRPRQDARRED